MDGISAALTTFGFGGCVVAAFIWIVWHLLTKTIPALTQVFREEIRYEREAATTQASAVTIKVEQALAGIGQANTKLDRLLDHQSPAR